MDETRITKEILPGIYRFSLSDTTVEQGVSKINIFIIPGKEGVNNGRSLMIDTGFKNDDCLKILEGALEELNIRHDQLDIFLTHRHHDHCGLAGIMAQKGSKLFMNPQEERHPYDCLAYRVSDESLEAQKKVLRSVGITADRTPEIWDTYLAISDRVQHHGKWVLAIWGFPYTEVHAGDKFCYGDYEFEAVPLKGHTYGQMGLKDYNKKLFFTADQLIHKVSPIIATTYPDEALLQGFFDSLRHIKTECSDWTIVPAHGEIIEDVPTDVDSIVFSYLDKATKARDLLKEVASEHSGETLAYHSGSADSRADYLTVQEVAEKTYGLTIPKDESEFFIYKMIITKTYSLLEYLHGLDFITREMVDGVFYWSYKY